MTIDWAAETVYWIERAKAYAIDAGVPQHEIDSIESCKETPRKEAKGQKSVVEEALGMNLENLSEQEKEVVFERAITAMGAIISIKMEGEGELELCCSNPNCPVRADIIMHNQQTKEGFN